MLKGGENMERPIIFDYENYRRFLEDWYFWMKECNDGFSYRAFSQWAGLHSPNHLQLVVQGKRNITKGTLPVFFKILKLNRREQKFFELLVNFNQTKTSGEKARYLQEISLFVKKYGDGLRHEQYEYLLKWYFPVLRELVTTKDFREDRHALARRIGHGVTPRQVDEAIEKLLALGLLRRDGTKRLVQDAAIISTGQETKESAAYFYHDQMLSLSKTALREQPPDERYIAGITLACRKEDVAEISQMLNDFRKNILDYLERRPVVGKDDEVYQLGLQLFRITTPRRTL